MHNLIEIKNRHMHNFFKLMLSVLHFNKVIKLYTEGLRKKFKGPNSIKKISNKRKKKTNR